VTCGTTVARARRGKTPSGPSWAERPDGLGPVSERRGLMDLGRKKKWAEVTI
jgi:hypothetical protein